MFGSTQTLVLQIEGMKCPHCQKHVETALKAIKGVKKVTVSLEEKTAQVAFVPAKTEAAALVQAVTEAGYVATL